MPSPPEPVFTSPANNDPYNFIMQPDTKKKNGLKLGGGNLPVTIGIIVGGAAILMIFVILIANLIGGSGSSSKSNLISLAQTQNEIVRVSGKAESAAKIRAVRNLAVTIDMSLTSQQQQVIGVLTKNGVKLDKQDLQLKQNGQTDQRLTSASSTNTFDKEYAKIMQEALGNYVTSLRQINTTSKSNTERQLTKEYITQTELLIAQIPHSVSDN